jgi:hypothetical protein
MPTPRVQKPKQKDLPKKSKSLAKFINNSTRLTLTYVVFVVWVALAVVAMLLDADLYSLAAYFASGLPIILGYMWAETSRPTPTLSEAADMVKSIGQSNRTGGSRRGGGGMFGSMFGGGNFGGGSFGGENSDNTNNVNVNVVQPNTQIQDGPEGDTSIYSDDASVELKVNSNQLTTLTNTGYVDMVGDKYTFKKSLLDQIKSLINDNAQTPNL